jgi:hypothetical protein
MPINRRQYWSIVYPVAALVYVAVMFLVDWDGTAVVVGAILLGIMALLARLVPLGPPPSR